MLGKIKESTIISKKDFDKVGVSIQVKSLFDKLSCEIQELMDSGNWFTATRLAFYRHEFAKTYKSLDWYQPYLEIRKVRDKISLLGGNNVSDQF